MGEQTTKTTKKSTTKRTTTTKKTTTVSKTTTKKTTKTTKRTTQTTSSTTSKAPECCPNNRSKCDNATCVNHDFHIQYCKKHRQNAPGCDGGTLHNDSCR